MVRLTGVCTEVLNAIVDMSYKLEKIVNKHKEDYMDYKEFVEGFTRLPKKLMEIGDKYEKEFKETSEDFLKISEKLIELNTTIVKCNETN
ncbi:MAG TPA: hypothetical protein VMT63_11695 [Bacteroidales bacterium]|nr:hypothetical protein [Bacteroidales bacterium]